MDFKADNEEHMVASDFTIDDFERRYQQLIKLCVKVNDPTRLDMESIVPGKREELLKHCALYLISKEKEPEQEEIELDKAKLIAENVNDPDIWYFLGAKYLDKASYPEADYAFKRSTSVKGDEQRARISSILLEMGNPEDARKILVDIDDLPGLIGVGKKCEQMETIAKELKCYEDSGAVREILDFADRLFKEGLEKGHEKFVEKSLALFKEYKDTGSLACALEEMAKNENYFGMALDESKATGIKIQRSLLIEGGKRALKQAEGEVQEQKEKEAIRAFEKARYEQGLRALIDYYAEKEDTQQLMNLCKILGDDELTGIVKANYLPKKEEKEPPSKTGFDAIKGISKSVAEELKGKYGDYKTFEEKANIQSLVKIPGIGEKKAKDILEQIKTE